VEKILENEMSWACGTYGKQDRYMQDLEGRPEERGPYEDLDL
jgi:hypothetical protein